MLTSKLWNGGKQVNVIWLFVACIGLGKAQPGHLSSERPRISKTPLVIERRQNACIKDIYKALGDTI